MNTTDFNENKQSTFDLKQEIFKYLPYWYFFVMGPIIALFIANIYLRYQNNVYQSKTIIKLLDDSNSDFKMPTSGVNFFMRSKINIENEKEILKSNRLLTQVIHELDLCNQFFVEGKIRVAEEFGPHLPTINWIGDQEKIDNLKGEWEITFDAKGYRWNEDKIRKEYNQIYDVEGVSMRVNAPIKPISGSKTIIFKKTTLLDVITSLKSNIEVNLVGDESELLEISTKGSVIDKNNAILNTLNAVFDRDGREDRQRVYKKTIDFVNNRFEFLFKELDTIELNKANYKRDQKLSFLEGDAGSLLASKTASSAEYEVAVTQSALSEIIITALKEVKNNELLPANIGLQEMQVNELVKQYNDIVLEAQKVIANGGSNHPSVAKLIAIQENLKNNIRYSLKAYQKILETKIQAIDKVKAMQEYQYGAVPYQEKTIRAIEREQKIKETLYLLLLQKREEASINLAIVNPSIKIVDDAIANTIPLSPKRGVTFLIAFSLGLLIPFGILFVYYLFDTKIHRKEDIENILEGIPVVAEIPFIEEKSKIVQKNSHTVLSESFRILVANLNFILPSRNSDEGISIYISSTVKGEGKTFVATNLALSLAALGKKVIIVGTDLRNPQLHKALKTKKERLGLVNLLIEESLRYQDCIKTETIQGATLDIIYSGDIPPNPTEILSNGKLESLLNELKQNYDYVIVDTAPTLLVADTTIITKHADVTLYLIKANFTEKQILSYINNLKQQNKIVNTSVVFNNVGQNEGYGKGYAYAYQYNYGYGYGYGVSAAIPSKFRRFKFVLFKLFRWNRN